MLKKVQHDIKRVAFTLAEVLIALTIIGVVATMTIPTLIQQQTEKANIVKLKKTYTMLNQAFEMAEIEYGPIKDWSLSLTSTGETDEEGALVLDPDSQIKITARFKEFLNADYLSEDTIIAKQYYTLNDELYMSDYKLSGANMGLALSDGTIFYPGWTNSPKCTQNLAHVAPDVCGDAWIVLGKKNKIKRGVDVFHFYLTKKGLVPDGRPNSCKRFGSSSLGEDGRGCTAWALSHENMEYLRCDIIPTGKEKCD